MSILTVLLRVLITGAVVVAVTEIAQRWPRLAAIMLFVPLPVAVIFVSMYLGDPRVEPIARLSRDGLVLIPLCLPMFIPLAFASRWNLPFWGAISLGLLMATMTISGYLYFTAGRA